ncbi:hypothetical protein TNCT_183391 [Trichonephila clavata]|uniref:Uncharacterized protein n=1 Tax=Trichonephila clavata TaxID=2740835 RepID=A0A8X6LW92_TRICU|nr:hypothetical protein TNCT_183391 [Trichonephila clavata]
MMKQNGSEKHSSTEDRLKKQPRAEISSWNCALALWVDRRRPKIDNLVPVDPHPPVSMVTFSLRCQSNPRRAQF